MKLSETFQRAQRYYRPALLLDRVLTPPQRRWVRLGSLVGAIACTVLWSSVYTFGTIAPWTSMVLGIGLVLVGVWALLLQFEWFYNSVRYNQPNQAPTFSYDAVRLIQTAPDDLAAAFVQSAFGSEVLARIGIFVDTRSQFLQSERAQCQIDTLNQSGSLITVREVAAALFDCNDAFREFLLGQSITKREFAGAVHWIDRVYAQRSDRRQWWQPRRVFEKSGFGAELAYGHAHELRRFTRPLESATVYAGLGDVPEADTQLVSRIETMLSNTVGANVLIVGALGVGKLDLLYYLDQKIAHGQSVSGLQHQHPVLFDKERFVLTYTDKTSFERAFVQLLNQAVAAGNIIFVIDNLPSFIRSATTLGVEFEELVAHYLQSTSCRVIATTTIDDYHREIESRGGLLQQFGTVSIERSNEQHTVRVLENTVPRYESQFGVFITYPAVLAVVQSANRYLTDGVMPQKAIDFLGEVVARARRTGQTLVDKQVVMQAVEEKVGIAVGEVSGGERQKLLNLETALHDRVIGQDRAITVVANALKRARAGLQSTDKPVGSFLFLGSTGVGKTETAKALAAVYYGSESALRRLDMSEFSAETAATQLLGTAEQPGVLANLLREHPHGVVLLDEFEKAHQSAHDLFLQIFDEGIFTDGRGNKVNARNSIFIVTSNAGSDVIWELVAAGETPSAQQARVVEHIIASGVYRPELINRFDAVVVFDPLTKAEQQQVAALLLDQLVSRVLEQGYRLEVTPELTAFVAEEGYSREFGARPMQRVIQDVVEAHIADKIIADGLAPGATITFTATELQNK